MKNLLDERQQQELARITSWKAGVMFWIVTISLLIKSYALDLPVRYYVTELVILLAAGGMELTCNVKAGIYDPYFRPTAGVTAAVSGASALAVGAAKFLGLWFRRPDLHENWVLTIGMSSLIMAAVVFVLCYFALMAWAIAVKRSQRRQEAAWEDEGRT